MFAILRMLGEEMPRRQQDAPLFCGSHLLPGFSKIGIPAQLDLHKSQFPPLLGDQVNFPHPAAVARRQKPISLLMQVARRLFFAPAAEERCIAAHSFFRKVSRWIGQGPYLCSIS